MKKTYNNHIITIRKRHLSSNRLNSRPTDPDNVQKPALLCVVHRRKLNLYPFSFKIRYIELSI